MERPDTRADRSVAADAGLGRYLRCVPPAWSLGIGAIGVSSSSIFIDLSGTSPGTASFFRCALALPLLWFLARADRRPRLPRGHRIAAAAAGALFAGDALLWTQAIDEVGAGLSTVLVNAQVFIVPLLALLVDKEKVQRTFLLSLPIMILGIVLTGGVFESGVSGKDSTAGTVHAVLAALCYSGFLFLLRRSGSGGQVIQTYGLVVATAAVVSLLAGGSWQGVTVTPGWAALGWLVLTAICGQVAGWLLVAVATPLLRADVGAALLMLTPVGSLLLAALALGEKPTRLQLIGCLLVLGTAYLVSSRPRPHRGTI